MSDPGVTSRSDRLLGAIEPLLFGRRKRVMGALLAITALLAAEISQIKPVADFDRSIPLGHPYMQVLKQYQPDFGSANTLRVALLQQDGDLYNEKFLMRLKAVTDDVAGLKGVDRARVSSLFTPDVRYVEVVDGAYKGGSVVPAEYQPSQPMFDLIRDNVAKGGQAGRYVSQDQRGAMIYAELPASDPVTGDKPDYGRLASSLEDIRHRYQGEGISLHIVGYPQRAADVLGGTARVAMSFGITLLIVFLLLWLGLGSFRLALLPLLAAAVSLIWDLGLLRLFGYGLDPLALLVPLLIAAVAVAHGLQYVNAWLGEILEHDGGAVQASRRVWRRLAKYGACASLITIAGFATVGWVPIGMIREMAIHAGLGMAAILIVSQLMLPLALSWIDIGRSPAFAARLQRRDAMFDRLWRLLSNRLSPQAAAVVILVSAALCGWALWQGRGLQIGSGQAGAPELLADSRYNQDLRIVDAQFASGGEVLKVFAETDPEACLKFDVMDQIDRFAWHLDNTAGVRATQSLPQAARAVNAAFSEANPKYQTLPRNPSAMSQAIAPIPVSSGLLNADCSALAVLAFMQDRRAATIARVIDRVQLYNRQNAAAFYESNKNVNPKYCNAKLDARRGAEAARADLRQSVERIRLRHPGAAEDTFANDPEILQARADAERASAKLAGLTKTCPVNFALAGGDIGVAAATHEELRRWQKPLLLYVYAAIAFCLYLVFFEFGSLIAILLPLSLVSWMAYALMSVAGIGITVATLPIVALAAGLGVAPGLYIYASMKDALAGGWRMQQACYRSLRTSGKCVIFTGLAFSLGVAPWLGSGLQFQRDLGLLLVFIFTANMLVTILVLPAIASFLLGEREPAAGE